MKKRGFTLIELLAVIVILAIIALIAVPMVLGVIDKAKEGAAEVSAEGYLNAVEKYIVMQDLKEYKIRLENNTTYKVYEDTEYEIAFLDKIVEKVKADGISNEIFLNDIINIKGDYPSDGYVKIGNKKIESATLSVNGYSVECDKDIKCEAVSKLDGSEVKAKSIEIDDVNVENLSKGDTVQLTATILPKNTTDKKILWKSSNEEVATITEEGLLTVVGYGTTTITARTINNKVDSKDLDLSIKIKEIAASPSYGLAIDTEGSLWSWGLNNYGELGNNSTTKSLVPIKIVSGTKFTSVTAGYNHNLSIDENNNLWTWGRNNYGQLGNNSRTNSLVPVQIMNGTKFEKISAGEYHSLAIDENGNLWTWGRNNYGQLGNNSNTDSLVPIKIMNGTTFVNIAAGRNHSMAIDEAGNIWTWGHNNFGQLGNNTKDDSKIPVQITSKIKFTNIQAGDNGHSLAIDESGSLWSWGYNNYGQLGNNSTKESLIPIQVMDKTKFTNISGGYNYSLAIDETGNLLGWGNNEHGQLGNNSTTNSLNVIPIMSGVQFTDIMTGQYNNLAIDESGNLWAWGQNNYGQLGNNSTTDSLVPIKVEFE